MKILQTEEKRRHPIKLTNPGDLKITLTLF